MSTAEPTFSVIIPAYNCARFVGSAIDSTLAQSFQDFEIVVCENGSTDNTWAVLQRHKPYIRTVQLEQNRNDAGGRNAAIAIARGRFLAFLDADDLWASDKLERYYRMISKYDSKFIFSNRTTIDIYGRTGAPGVSPRRGNQQIIQPKDPLLLMVNFITTSCVVVDAESMKKHPFNEDVYPWGDYLAWLELNQEMPFFYIPRGLSYLRTHQANIARTYRDIDRSHRFLDLCAQKNMYPSDLIDFTRSLRILEVQAYQGKRSGFIFGLLKLLTTGPKRRLLAVWIFYHLRFLKAGTLRKWITWPVTGRTRNYFGNPKLD